MPKSTLKHVHIDAEIMLFICRPCQSFQFVEFWAGEAMVSKVVSHSGRDVASLDIDYFKPDPSGRHSTNYYDVLTSSGFAYLWLNFCKCFCCLGALKNCNLHVWLSFRPLQVDSGIQMVKHQTFHLYNSPITGEITVFLWNCWDVLQVMFGGYSQCKTWRIHLLNGLSLFFMDNCQHGD